MLVEWRHRHVRVSNDNIRDTDPAGQSLINLGFIFELRVFCLDTFKLDGYLLTRDDVDSKVDITWVCTE